MDWFTFHSLLPMHSFSIQKIYSRHNGCTWPAYTALQKNYGQMKDEGIQIYVT